MKALALSALLCCAATAMAPAAHSERAATELQQLVVTETVYNPTFIGFEADGATGRMPAALRN